MVALPFDAALSAVRQWLQQKSTPVCWVMGTPTSGKTALAQQIVAASKDAQALLLSAASPDRCLQNLCGVRTTAGLSVRLSAGRTPLLVLDALDTVQYADEARLGFVADLRLRLLLSSAARKQRGDLNILVTSRIPPPGDLPPDAVNVIELAAVQQPSSAEPAFDANALAVLEVLASSRTASSGWLLGLLTASNNATASPASPPSPPSLATPDPVRRVLENAVSAGLVYRVAIAADGEWFQMRDSARLRFLPAARAATVHRSLADVLLSDHLAPYLELAALGDPELRHDLLERAMLHLLAADAPVDAVRCYWHQLGNYARLEYEHALHLGVRACSALNNEYPPQQIAPELRTSPGAMSIVNDWGVHAICLGDATLAAAAARAAFELSTNDNRPWDRSMLAYHTAEALLACGRLQEAMQWAERAKEFATAGLRLSEGMPTQEIMAAYDNAYFAAMSIAAEGHDVAGMAETLTELVELHTRVRKRVVEFNSVQPLIPIEGPTGDVDPEELVNGKLASLLALLEDRPDDAIRILTTQLARWTRAEVESQRGVSMRTLLLRALLADQRYPQVRELLIELQPNADALDDTAARYELASLAARLALAEGDAAAAVASIADFPDQAALCGLQVIRNDLLRVRSQALLALGRADEAQIAADAIQHLAPAPAIPIPEKRLQPTRAPEEPRKSGPERRMQLHDAALKVLEDYQTRGLPFAVYFRKFDFTVMQGPLEFGSRLIENVLVEAMPPGANVVAIQDHGDSGYYGSGTSVDRSAPSFLLADDEWQEVARLLIRFADLIVHEPYLLGGGTRWELETIVEEQRWDRTVLLLPPLRSPLALLDSEPVIQMYPRCIWADTFHTRPLPENALIRDLITRMAQIAALPEDARRRLTDPAARDAAYPIDLRPIASYYEINAAWSAQWQDEDDRVRYYGFWQLFRATAIRFVLMSRGDDSFENRSHIADSYVQMSSILLDHETEGDKIVLIGDLDFAEQCAESAYNLMRASDGAVAAYNRAEAEAQYGRVMALRDALKAQPDRFVLRPRYGPFTVSVLPRDQTKQ